jgi:hypothetical protein
MEEKLKSALINALNSKISELQERRERASVVSKNLEKLSELVTLIEQGFENLKRYDRETLSKILTPYYSTPDLQRELDRLEIVKLVFNLQTHGMEVELNEEEINIMVEFLDKIREEKNNEYMKYEKIALKNKEQLNEDIKLLKQIHEKVTLGDKGKNIIMGKEIDRIMQLAIEEEADEDTQIAVLVLLNKINLGIGNNIK